MSWTESKRATSSHAWKLLDEESGMWIGLEEEVNSDDPRIHEGQLVDLSQRDLATDQPVQFWEASLNTMMILIPHVTQADRVDKRAAVRHHSLTLLGRVAISTSNAQGPTCSSRSKG